MAKKIHWISWTLNFRYLVDNEKNLNPNKDIKRKKNSKDLTHKFAVFIKIFIIILKAINDIKLK